MKESSATQSVRAIAIRADRARRVSAARVRVARYALPVSATACVLAGLSPMLGGPGSLGLSLLAAGVIVAAVMLLAARFYPITVHDPGVAQVDRAAGLDGSLRSAHWFADPGRTGPAVHATRGWVASHLENAAARAAEVDWTRVYPRPSMRLSWAVTVCCALLTVGLSVRPLPRLARRTMKVQNAEATPTGAPSDTATATAADTPGSLAPQILAGMKAMRAGRKPSEEQLSAIGEALETARHDPDARKRIEAEVNGSAAKGDDDRGSAPSDSQAAAWSDDYHNGFEMSDLDWAYQEALARGRSEETPHVEPGGEVTPPAGTTAPSGKGRQGEPTAAGQLTGTPVEGDTRGRPIDFTSLLRGSQHASSGTPGAPDQAAETGRAARLAAALRTEVVHASSAITLPDLDRPAARRATNASKAPAAAGVTTDHVRYDRSHATQPPAVPDARRPLLRGFFLRPAEPAPVVKRP